MLFAGGRNGQFFALDARSAKGVGDEPGIIRRRRPMAYAVNGKQYMSIQAGECTVHLHAEVGQRLFVR